VPRVRSFPPVETAGARVLILGSMPGAASLRAGQYYAHPQNLFWKIICDLLGAGPDLGYAARVQLLKSSGIALWDVLASCEREGSLDSAIDDASIVPNDFAAFYRRHPGVRHVFFNGAKAEAAYVRHVHREEGCCSRTYQRLPSTSPAHASRPYDEKRKLWRAVAVALGVPGVRHKS